MIDVNCRAPHRCTLGRKTHRFSSLPCTSGANTGIRRTSTPLPLVDTDPPPFSASQARRTPCHSPATLRSRKGPASAQRSPRPGVAHTGTRWVTRPTPPTRWPPPSPDTRPRSYSSSRSPPRPARAVPSRTACSQEKKSYPKNTVSNCAMVEKDSPSQPEGWRRRWWWWGGEGSEGRGTSPGNPPTTTRPIILPPGRRIAAPAQHARRGELPIRILRLLKKIFQGCSKTTFFVFFFSSAKRFKFRDVEISRSKIFRLEKLKRANRREASARTRTTTRRERERYDGMGRSETKQRGAQRNSSGAAEKGSSSPPAVVVARVVQSLGRQVSQHLRDAQSISGRML